MEGFTTAAVETMRFPRPLTEPINVPGRKRHSRPSLLEQLHHCQSNSDNLIADLRQALRSHKPAPKELLLTLRTRSLRVGRCTDHFPGVARFYPTLLVYAFDHPVHR